MAPLSLSSLAAGSHRISALYNGDANNPPSSSPMLVQTVAATAAMRDVELISESPSASRTNREAFTAQVSPGTATSGRAVLRWCNPP